MQRVCSAKRIVFGASDEGLYRSTDGGRSWRRLLYLNATTGAYDVGDRIELDGTRGDVIRYGLLTTTILEIGPTHQRTGRSIVLPNSLLLSKPVVNETFTATYVLHSFAVPMARSADWQATERRLQAVAQRVCAEWIEPARRQLEELSREHGLTPPSVEPAAAWMSKAASSLPASGRLSSNGGTSTRASRPNTITPARSSRS